jgi:hypothetical protein
MRGTGPRSASEPDHPVWHALSSYTVGPADAALSFAQRLARENGWSGEFAARVIAEYKRFCFLAVTGAEEVTPSDQVDQAWHLHLTYTRDYWERFCPEVLGKRLHHGPTKGGAEEQGRFFEQYARTLRRYDAVFGEPPPADIWPDARRRLFDDPRARRVHPREALVVPRRLLWPVLAGAVILVTFVVVLRSLI